MIAITTIKMTAMSCCLLSAGGGFGGFDVSGATGSTTTRVPFMASDAHLGAGVERWRYALSVTAPQTSPSMVTRPARAVSSGSIGDRDDARETDQPVGADAGIHRVFAHEPLRPAVQEDEQDRAAEHEHRPLDLDRDVVEREDRRGERRERPTAG